MHRGAKQMKPSSQPPPGAANPQNKTGAPGLRRIAVAGPDDELVARVRDALDTLDCELLHAPDRPALLTLAENDALDLVLVDADALGADAGALTLELKAAAPRTMVMPVSASDSPDVPIAALRAGAYDFFRKPCSADDLRQRISCALENKSQGEAASERSRQLEDMVADRSHEILAMKTYLENLLDTAGDAIFTVGTDGRVTSWNDSAAHILGYSKEEMVGADVLVLASGEGARVQLADILRAAAEGRTSSNVETPWLRKDRKEAIVSFTVSPIRSPESGVAGILTVARDITERRKLQEELFHSGKLASIGQLAAGVAHQINNPLGAISGRAQMLLRRAPDVEPDFLVAQLEKIHADCTRITDTVNDLLGFARKTETVKQYTDVNTVIDETLEMVEHEIIAHKAHTELSYSANLPPIVASDHHLRQLFANLVTNACDAMAPNGVLSIATRFRPSSDEQAEPVVEVAFADTGSGIPEEELPRIFEPFYTTKPPGEGTGLGLAVAKRIVDFHNGSIDVESTVGQGTTFLICFPVE
jgi:PAS domain S-box-containing protein